MRLTLPLRFIRWVLLVLYGLLLASLVAIGITEFSEPLGTLTILAITVVSQAALILGAGSVQLSRPIRGWRLLIPVAVAAVMMVVLAGGLGLALGELFDLADEDWLLPVIAGFMGISWIFWGSLLFIYCRAAGRFTVLQKITAVIFAGSLVVLLVSIPAHIMVSRRPGCFVGLYTMAGIVSGIYVLLWSFGPGIILLFLREKRRFELRENQRAGDGPNHQTQI